MISVKQAYEKAIEYTREHAGLLEYSAYRLEEVSSGGPSDDSWLITLSMVANAEGGGRHYKLYQVRKETGEVIAMKIRHLP